jgi:hypothetical protein
MGLYDFAVLDVRNLDQVNTGALADHYAASLISNLAQRQLSKRISSSSLGEIRKLPKISVD